jgi:hypothetical protein
MSLSNDFNDYVGLIIKDPHRMTADTDPEGEKIYALAQRKGLALNFIKADQPHEPFMADVEALHVTITKEGLPEEQASWGYRVTALQQG